MVTYERRFEVEIDKLYEAFRTGFSNTTSMYGFAFHVRFQGENLQYEMYDTL